MGNVESAIEELGERAAESFIPFDSLAEQAADEFVDRAADGFVDGTADGFVESGFEATEFADTVEISGDGVEITAETVEVSGEAVEVTTDFATGIETTTVVEFDYAISSIYVEGDPTATVDNFSTMLFGDSVEPTFGAEPDVVFDDDLSALRMDADLYCDAAADFEFSTELPEFELEPIDWYVPVFSDFQAMPTILV